MSFHDLDAVSKACNVVIPTCGTGLRCWPDGGTVVAADGAFVSCAACPHPSLSSATSTTALAVSLGVFVVLAMAAVAMLVYVLRAVIRAGVPSPLPLPAAVARWCGAVAPSATKGSTNDGVTDSLMAN